VDNIKEIKNSWYDNNRNKSPSLHFFNSLDYL